MAANHGVGGSQDDLSGVRSPGQPAPLQDILFCPYCGQMSFRLGEAVEESVYCEFCGVDVAIHDLVKVV